MSSLTKAVYVSIGGWLTALAVLFVFPYWLPTLSGLATLISLPVCVLLLLLALVALFRDRNKLPAGLAVLLIPLLFLAALSKGLWLGARANLYLSQDRYEAKVKQVLSVRDQEESRKICGERWWVMSFTDKQVAFHYLHGFLNWHDLVYDPSGELIKVKTIEERHRVSTYFVSAERLTGDWYLCHFGD